MTRKPNPFDPDKLSDKNSPAQSLQMKRNPFLLALIVTITLFTVSCKKGGKTGLLIPKDAGLVVYFNTGSLSSKLSWSEIKQSEWFKEMENDARNQDAFTKTLVNNPDSAGIDMDKGFCFVFSPKGRGSIASFQGHLKDQKAFEAVLKSNDKTSGTPAKSGDLNILELDGTSVLSWNSERFLVVVDAPMGLNATQRFPQDSIVHFSKNLHALKGDDLLDSDKRFASLIAANGDLQVWVNSGSFSNDMSMGMLNMLKLSSLTEGNYTTASLSFDDGQINLNGNQYYNKELAKIFDKYTSKGVTSDLTNRLPGGEVLLAGAYSYPMGALVDMIKLIGADGVANVFLGQKGLTLDDISKAFKGDFAFALTDVISKADTITYEGYNGKPSSFVTKRPVPEFVFGAAIDDQTAFDKVYNVVEDDLGKIPPSMASIKIDKGWLVLGSSSEMHTGFYAGNNKPAYGDKLNGHEISFYFNFQRLFDIIARDTKDDSSGIKLLNASKEMWQEALIYTDYKKDGASYRFEVNLVDKKTNSLKQLKSYADRLSAIRKERLGQNYAYPDMTDTVEAPPKAFN